MSELKYKVGDSFKHNQNGCIIDIIDTQEDKDPYIITGGLITNDYHLDFYFTKIEPNTTSNTRGEEFVDNAIQGKPSDFKKIFSSLCDMVEAKDKNYGNAALKPLDIFAKHHPYGSRLDEKLARVKNSDNIRKNDVGDLIGGLALICKDMGWTNFDDQLD